MCCIDGQENKYSRHFLNVYKFKDSVAYMVCQCPSTAGDVQQDAAVQYYHSFGTGYKKRRI
jgi:hypothetical protein